MVQSASAPTQAAFVTISQAVIHSASGIDNVSGHTQTRRFPSICIRVEHVATSASRLHTSYRLIQSSLTLTRALRG
jgi:hypothetical protein